MSQLFDIQMGLKLMSALVQRFGSWCCCEILKTFKGLQQQFAATVFVRLKVYKIVCW